MSFFSSFANLIETIEGLHSVYDVNVYFFLLPCLFVVGWSRDSSLKGQTGMSNHAVITDPTRATALKGQLVHYTVVINYGFT